MKDDPIWPAFGQSTASFRLLYEGVTKRLYLRKLRLLREDERQWLQFLIDRFESEYRAWESKPVLLPYLEVSDRNIQSSRLLSVLAYTYLHVCYDLPRVIADSFVFLEEDKAHEIYQHMSVDFSEVLEVYLANPAIFGKYSYPWKFLRKQLPGLSRTLARNFNNWLLTRRSEAWLNALVLQRDPLIRPEREMYIINHLYTTARNVMELTKNPLEWTGRLDSPVFSFGFPAAAVESAMRQNPNLIRQDEKD